MHFSILTNEVSSSPNVLKLLDPTVFHCVGGKITTSKAFMELQLSRMDQFSRKHSSTINVFCSVVHSISKLIISSLIEHVTFLTNRKYEKNGLIIPKVIQVQVLSTLPAEPRHACYSKQRFSVIQTHNFGMSVHSLILLSLYLYADLEESL